MNGRLAPSVAAQSDGAPGDLDTLADLVEAAPGNGEALRTLAEAARFLITTVFVRIDANAPEVGMHAAVRLADAFASVLPQLVSRLPILDGQVEQQTGAVVTLARLLGQPPEVFETFRMSGALDDLLDVTGIVACLAEVAHRNEQIASRSDMRQRVIAIAIASQAAPGTAALQ